MASPTSGLAAPRSRPPPWINLPPEIITIILQKLGTVEILLSARRVCTTWRNICKDPAMWHVIDMVTDKFDGRSRRCRQEMKLCRHIVDLSRGELIDIEVHGDNELLDYIAQRSAKLRRLRIANFYEFCGKALSEAVKKFPLLEEMHLNYWSIEDQSIQCIIDIASSCRLLTSLTLNAYGSGYRSVSDSNQLAFVVSSMSKLRHLKIFGCKMTNEGLAAILDGCSQLQSLDLRRCSNLELGGKLGERCSQQIKDLRLPNDSTEDYALCAEFDKMTVFPYIS